MPYLRHMSCVALFACLTLTPGQGTAHDAIPSPDASPAASPTTPEARLRKLHLVRPDLIPYPIAYEIYC